jgi:hypothetical protein
MASTAEMRAPWGPEGRSGDQSNPLVKRPARGAHGLVVDGVVGPTTWRALLGG